MNQTAFIPTKQDLESAVQKAVEQTVNEVLPDVIRKATRKKWLTTDEVMTMLQCSRRHVQYLRDSEQLPYTKNGRTIRYNIDDIEDFLNDHKVDVL